MLNYYSDLQEGPLANMMLQKIETLYNTRGPEDTVRYFKLTRLSITKTLGGEAIPRPFGIALADDSLPRFLPKEIRSRILAKEFQLISLVLTLSSISKLILGNPKTLKTKTITDAFTGEISPINSATVAIVLRRMGVPKIHIQEKAFAFP